MASKSVKNRATITSRRDVVAGKPALSASKTAPARAAMNSSSALAGWLFPAYLAVIFIGYLLLRTPGAMTNGQEMGKVRGLFSAVSAGTLTGFSQTTDIDKYQPLGQATVLGLIVCGSVLSLIIGGTAISRILRLGYSDGQIVLAALIAEGAAIAVGALLLLFDHERTWSQAIFLAASAFGNCGLIMGPAPVEWQLHLIVLPLVIVGGLGLTVLMELHALARKRIVFLSPHARAALGGTALVYVVGTAVLVLLGLWAANFSFDSLPMLREIIGSSSAAAIASRTAGLSLLTAEHLSRAAIWFVMLLMCIGGASGSTAGGMKVTTLVEIIRGVRKALAGETPGRGFGIAAAWCGGFLLLIAVALLCLLHMLPQMPADHVLLLAISAASNVGASAAPLNPDRNTAYILCATMLIGRMAPLMVLWWMADTSADSEIAVG